MADFTVLDPMGLFLGLGSVKTFLRLTNVDYQFFVLEVRPYPFVFNLTTFEAFCTFGTLGAILGLDSGIKTFLGPTYVDYQLWFWRYSPIFLFLIQLHLGSFLSPSSLFLGHF